MARSNLDLATVMGKRMAQRRKECGLTQEEVADLADITHQQYNRVENGKACLSSDSLRRISLALQVSADYLLFGTNPSDKYIAMIELLDKMNDDKRKLANKLIMCLSDYSEEQT